MSVCAKVLSRNRDQEVTSPASLTIGKSVLNTHQQIGRLNDDKSWWNMMSYVNCSPRVAN